MTSRRLRFEILRRDNYTCRYCGASTPDVVLTVDHVVPIALGGDDDPRNLVAACADCNAGKSSIQPDSPLVEDVEATAMLFAKAIDIVTERRREEQRGLEAEQEWFVEAWRPILGGMNYSYLPDTWGATVARFIASGLDREDFERFMLVTCDKNLVWNQRFRYFCGCCWKEVGLRQEEARKLIEDGGV